MCAVVGPTLGVPFQEQDSVVEAVCGWSVERGEEDEAERGSTSYTESVRWFHTACVKHECTRQSDTQRLARGPSLHPPLEIRRRRIGKSKRRTSQTMPA